MKTKKWFMITAIVCGLLMGTFYVNAQTNQQPNNRQSRGQGQGSEGEQGPPRHPPHPVMTALDADRDHVISAAEIAGAAKALLTIDQNGDGMLSLDEIRPQRPNRGGQQDRGRQDREQMKQGQQRQNQQSNQQQSRKGNRMQGQQQNRPEPPELPAMKAMDTDGDKQLSAHEIANAPKALLTLDKNGDGKLTHNEIRPEPPSGRQQNRRQN
jgi:EF hand